MPAADYATVEDLKKHWPALEAEREAEAKQKMHEASVEIRGLYPDVDGRIEQGVLDPDIPRLVVCRMVRRALAQPQTAEGLGGVASASVATGPFSQNLTFASPDVTTFLRAADHRLLRRSRGNRQAWTIRPTGGALA